MFEMTTGMPYPLGATPDEEGTNFAISVGKNAEKVVLCLIGADGAEECLALTERSGNTWHAHVAGVGGGQLYGYRIHGPWDPARGLRYNPAKILIDPYAKAIEGDFNWGQHQFSYSFDNPDEIDSTDSLGHTMVGVVWPALEISDSGPP